MYLKHFIAVAPPDDYIQKIDGFWRDVIPEAMRPHTEPHIKVKSQMGLDTLPGWIETVEAIAADIQPFKVKLAKPEKHGDLLTLTVESEQIATVHDKLVDGLRPAPKGGVFEGDVDPEAYFDQEAFFTPHLTLANGLYDAPRMEKKLRKLAEKNLAPYPEFEVTELRIYEAIVMDFSYRHVRSIPLGTGHRASEGSLVSAPGLAS